MNNKNKDKYLFIVSILFIILSISITMYVQTKMNTNSEADSDEDEIVPLNIENVGDIALTSIKGVDIQVYEEDDFAEARYTRDGEHILDFYQVDNNEDMLSGSDYTNAFKKGLIRFFDYPENITITGDANFTSHDAIYVLDEDNGASIVGLFILGSPNWLILEIPKFPVDAAVKEQLNKDIMHYSNYYIDYDFNALQSMKKVGIKYAS